MQLQIKCWQNAAYSVGPALTKQTMRKFMYKVSKFLTSWMILASQEGLFHKICTQSKKIMCLLHHNQLLKIIYLCLVKYLSGYIVLYQTKLIRNKELCYSTLESINPSGTSNQAQTNFLCYGFVTWILHKKSLTFVSYSQLPIILL